MSPTACNTLICPGCECSVMVPVHLDIEKCGLCMVVVTHGCLPVLQEAHKMVREANVKQATAEKQLKEAQGKIDVLQAEVSALKTMVLTSTPSSPNRQAHPQLLSPGTRSRGASPRHGGGHTRNKSASWALPLAPGGHLDPPSVSLQPVREDKEVGDQLLSDYTSATSHATSSIRIRRSHLKDWSRSTNVTLGSDCVQIWSRCVWISPLVWTQSGYRKARTVGDIISTLADDKKPCVLGARGTFFHYNVRGSTFQACKERVCWPP
uniref:Uncharacterized protein n=1 Tax=Hucho hucho TaxID=62062 RepID=A0A4W5KYC5_9TELE